MYILTAENMKKAESKANKDGFSFKDMMEAAGTKCAEFIANENKDGRETKKTVILCGKGKNGGDGLVIARHMWSLGFKNIFVISVHGKITDALCVEMLELAKKYPIDITDMETDPERAVFHISSADIIIDAVFGIGFKGELGGNSAEAVLTANKNKDAKKYAVDIPSGLSAQGEYSGRLCFETDVTLSMIAYKKVHVFKPSADMCGRTHIIDIGIKNAVTEAFSEKYTAPTDDEIFLKIKKRKYDSHKGSYGKILTVCGSRNMTGCVYLCNRAAVEIGAGLVTAAFPDCIYPVAAAKLAEPLMMPLKSGVNGSISLCEELKRGIGNFDVTAVGCGIGVSSDTKQVVEYIIKNASGVVILDADAINCIAENADILTRKKDNCEIILTPHPGEMSRITGKPISEIQENRIETAADFALKYGVTLLLKGANTVIADKTGKICVNTTGNAGMARGGSGDVLKGIISGLVPQTESAFDAACAGAYIHGKTADYIASKYGMISATPSRIIENIHKIGIFKNFGYDH